MSVFGIRRLLRLVFPLRLRHSDLHQSAIVLIHNLLALLVFELCPTPPPGLFSCKFVGSKGEATHNSRYFLMSCIREGLSVLVYSVVFYYCASTDYRYQQSFLPSGTRDLGIAGYHIRGVVGG